PSFSFPKLRLPSDPKRYSPVRLLSLKGKTAIGYMSRVSGTGYRGPGLRIGDQGPGMGYRVSGIGYYESGTGTRDREPGIGEREEGAGSGDRRRRRTGAPITRSGCGDKRVDA